MGQVENHKQDFTQVRVLFHYPLSPPTLAQSGRTRVERRGDRWLSELSFRPQEERVLFSFCSPSAHLKVRYVLMTKNLSTRPLALLMSGPWAKGSKG